MTSVFNTWSRLSGKIALLAALGLLFWGGSGYAIDDSYWLHNPATPGDWYGGANWTLGTPDTSFTVHNRIENGGTAQVTSGHAVANLVKIGNVSGTSGAMTVSNDAWLSIEQTLIVGGSGTANFELSGTARLYSEIGLFT